MTKLSQAACILLAGTDPHKTEISHVFHNKYILNNKNIFQVEIWPISCLNDLETQERGLQGAKIPNISWGSPFPDPTKSLSLQRSFRKSVSLYPRSVPDLYAQTDHLSKADIILMFVKLIALSIPKHLN